LPTTRGLEFSQRDICALLHESEFTQQIYCNYQLSFLHAKCIGFFSDRLSISQLAFVFNMNEIIVGRSLKSSLQDLAQRGRHASLDEEREKAFSLTFKNETGSAKL
jgi:hypothetical protein